MGHCAKPAVESTRFAAAKNLAEGAAVIAKGKSVGANTQRERTISTRSARCTPTMRRSITAPAFWPMPSDGTTGAALSGDDEAQIHYALALNTSASQPTKPRQPAQGAAILEPIAERQPQHPGVSHY